LQLLLTITGKEFLKLKLYLNFFLYIVIEKCYYRKIYAVEMNVNRYKTLCEFVTRTNAECIKAIQEDALQILPEQYENVKYILVDPSCSGSGMIDRIETREESNENLYYRLKKLQCVQSMLLTRALLDFPNVTKVIYSTCSMYVEENESVISIALNRAGNMFKLVNLRKKLKNEWHNFGSEEHFIHGNKCLYALPEKDFCRGFFMAMFKRNRKTLDKINDSSETCIVSSMSNEIQDDEHDEVPMKKKKTI
jgi:putative methyltransferase